MRPVANRGFTIIETCVTTFVILLLVGCAFAVVGEMTYFLRNEDTRYAFAINASMGLTKLDTELREIGRATVNGSTYPAISDDGRTLTFVRLADPPCDFAGTGEILWDPTVYTVRVHDGRLGICEGNIHRVKLCSNVKTCTFSIAGKRLTVDLVLEKTDQRGRPITHSIRRVTVMRN